MTLVNRRGLVLATAGAQLASPAAFALAGGNLDTPDDPALTPPAPAFAIWGAITTLSFAYAVEQARPSRQALQLLDDLTPALTAAFAGFVLWLAAAGLGLVWLSIAIFLAMLAALIRALMLLTERGGELPRSTRTLAGTAIGLYAGWSTVAVWVNLAAALTDSGLDPRAPRWQLPVLLGAGATALLGTARLRAPVGYVAALLWGFGGVATGAYRCGESGLATLALLSGGAVLATAVAARRPSLASWS